MSEMNEGQDLCAVCGEEIILQTDVAKYGGAITEGEEENPWIHKPPVGGFRMWNHRAQKQQVTST